MDEFELEDDYLHDDDEYERDGTYPTSYHLEELRAQRYELTRQLALLIQDAEMWAEDSEDEDAETILNLLYEAHELLGEAPEEED